MESLSVIEARQIIGTDLGIPKKMPGFAFGISAFDCITGSELRKIPGSVCNKCYAMRGNYTFNHMKGAYARRLEGMNDPRWVDAMVTLIKDKQRRKGGSRKS